MFTKSATWSTALIMIVACARSEENTKIPKRQYPTVDAQTSEKPEVEPEVPKPSAQKPKPTTTIVTPQSPTSASANSSSASASATSGIVKADISGWWLSPSDASASQDSSFSIGTNGLKCKAFSLINETKLKLASGWECWDYSHNVETFHVAHLGTIVGLANGQLSYKVEAGCDQNNLNSTQAISVSKGSGQNGKPAIMVSSRTAQNEYQEKVTPGPTAEGWILQPTATNWTVRVGCLDGSGNFSNGSTFGADQLFGIY